MKQLSYLIYFLPLFIIFSSCKSVEYVQHSRSALSTVVVGTEGITITGNNPEFTWKNGEVYTVPGNWDYGHISFDKPIQSSQYKGEDGVRVRVKVPQQKEPLYGFLQLGKIIDECKNTSQSTRIYNIRIPATYIEAANGGRVSVVYDYYECPHGRHTGGNAAQRTIADKKLEKYNTSWILWLSDTPLP